MTQGQPKSDAPDRNTWSATEQRLAAIWQEILNVEHINRDDGFVARGGDSIAATLCAADVYEAFAVELPTVLLLEETTTLTTAAVFIDQILTVSAQPA